MKRAHSGVLPEHWPSRVPSLSYAQEVFDSESVLDAFEAATGVRLEPKDFPDDDRWEALHPVAQHLPHVQIYESPKLDEDRFGGRFSVRIRDSDDPDEGVRVRGFERWLPERGPQEYVVSATAERANVDIIFWSNADQITPDAEAAWSVLTSFLHRL